MRKIAAFLSLLAFLISGNYVLVDEVMAIVGNKVITLSEVKKYDDQLRKFLSTKYKGREFEKIYRSERKRVLDNLIDKKLMLEKAKEEGINADEELKIAMKNMARQYKYSTVKELENAMAKQGINIEEWKENAKENILQQKLVQKEIDLNIKVTEGEIRSYYESHRDEFSTQNRWELKALKIEKGKEFEEKKAKIDKLLKEKGFEEAVRLSAPPFNSTGGKLGNVSKEELRPEFLNGIREKKDGEITGWIETEDGWYRLKVVRFFPSKTEKLEEVRNKIEKKIFSQKRKKKIKEFIEKLRKEIYVKVLRNYS